MAAKYFNSYEFKQAINTLHKDPYNAMELFENYLENYPNDYCAYPSYIYCLVMIGEIEKASEILDYVESMVSLDAHFQSKTDKFDEYSNRIVLAKMRILARQEKYQEIYDLYFDNPIDLKDEYRYIIYYCKNKLGLLDSFPVNQTYMQRQIINYSEENFKEHIKKHLANYNADDSKQNLSIFGSDFMLDEVINEIKKYIPSENKLCHGLFEDAYIFKYDACGRVNNKLTNYFKVVTFAESSNFITMYPARTCENLPYTDFNYLVDQKPKVKVLSQTEKFNRRYRGN
ncbi:MAG: hypothetical protein IKE75_04160 [Bacilli bacterium]|nr:hypothetical protein [Bacilli bacterium]